MVYSRNKCNSSLEKRSSTPGPLRITLGLPWCPEVKNPPANTGGTQVQSLIQEDPSRCGATEPMHPAPEPVFHSPCSTARETTAVEACTPQLD